MTSCQRTLLALSAAYLCASGAAPQPPCAAPPRTNPAVPESMCSSVVAHGKGVVVRSYGVPATEVLVTDLTPGNFDYAEVLNISISNILLYLAEANHPQARTVPVTVRPPGDAWYVSMMVSTVAFPDPAAVPTPANFEMSLEPVAERLFATLAFNTTALPREAEFKAACARLALDVPKAFSVVAGKWTPAYAIYSPRDAELFTNECWMEVKHV